MGKRRSQGKKRRANAAPALGPWDEAEVLVDKLETDGYVKVPFASQHPTGAISLSSRKDQWDDDVYTATIHGEVPKKVLDELEHRFQSREGVGQDIEIRFAPVFLAVQYEFREGDDGHRDALIIESVAGGSASAREHLQTMAESGDSPLWPEYMDRGYPDWDRGAIEKDAKQDAKLFRVSSKSASAQEDGRELYDQLVNDGYDEETSQEEVDSQFPATTISIKIVGTGIFTSLADAMEFVEEWTSHPDRVVIDVPEQSSNPVRKIKNRVLR